MKARFLIATCLLVSSQISRADDPGMTLAAQNACLTCHDIQQKKIGPPFHAVAERYRNDPPAFDKLLYKVQHGGAGNWGNYPMPPNPQANPDDLKAIVKWVLNQ